MRLEIIRKGRFSIFKKQIKNFAVSDEENSLSSLIKNFITLVV